MSARLNPIPAFIETQFPIARLSAEAYKERKANNGQTLTRLGKWWGRKPLILVRASILGMLMPGSGDAKRDREIFLKILTMDDEGTWLRCKPAMQRKTNRAAFDAKPYAERIAQCERPENVEGPTAQAWGAINAHLGTGATKLSELIEQLGQRAFGHTPRVGDSFCGGGSIPFEAARMGCEAFGSDLNPVAGLLTWASLNLLGGGKAVQEEVMRVQAQALQSADRQVTEWGIEHNAQGERADAYLYCVEVKPEGCNYYIPLAPSWLVGEKSKVVARWHRVAGSDRLAPEIVVVSDAELKRYKDDKKGATAVDSRVVDPFDAHRSWSIEALRGPDGLRRWTNDDVVPRAGDVFQERLYCIRWVDAKGNRRYAAPDAADLAREKQVLALLRDRFAEWQSEGIIPSKAIPEDGDKTEEPIRRRGWTYWHHLFTPRQLLTHGVLAEVSGEFAESKEARVGCLLGMGRIANWDSRGSAWMWHGSNEKGDQTFNNQALNTLVTYSGRGLDKLGPSFQLLDSAGQTSALSKGWTGVVDARDLSDACDMWVTDPPYADAVNYHELGDFFLAWYDKELVKAFPEWTPDASAELAVRGDGEDFRRSMVEIYTNLTRRMPDNGLQMVMFTHQDPAVWADLGMILWAAGLKATAAWTISTETEAVGIKKGNYVQGTVCLVLRKRAANEHGFLDEVYLCGTFPGVTRRWLDLGCILFSQYYDTARWVGDELAKRPEFAGMDIGLYAGSNRSGLWRNEKFQRCDRNDLKARVRAGELKLLLGTDAASEGLNLQRLGTLINIDLPWNPTRLEQRKGRIQRIGQVRNEIWIANLRYRDSVEDRVHQVLADRLEAIHGLFGQIPDTLEDVWVQMALNDEHAAHQLIDRTTATRNPFDAKYSKVEDADWETCASVLNGLSVKEMLSQGW